MEIKITASRYNEETDEWEEVSDIYLPDSVNVFSTLCTIIENHEMDWSYSYDYGTYRLMAYSEEHTIMYSWKESC